MYFFICERFLRKEVINNYETDIPENRSLKRYQYCSQGSSIKNNDAYFRVHSDRRFY